MALGGIWSPGAPPVDALMLGMRTLRMEEEEARVGLGAAPAGTQVLG